MADDFAQMIPDARAFFTELAANNNKDWWVENKQTYETALKAPALLFLDVMADRLRKLTGGPITTKLFRPHRDVRFSKDKTPYNAHLHMLWGMGDGQPAFFLGISPTYIRVGAGQMHFDKEQLLRWRAAVDSGGAILEAVLAGQAAGYELNEPPLKRVPSPYPKDHPHGELLKRKGCALWGHLPSDTDDLTDSVSAAFSDLWPLCDALRDL